MMRVKDDPATRLRMLMAERDVNTRELCQMTGLNDTTVSGIRSGRIKRPKSETRYLIADALGVNPSVIWPDL